MDAIGERDLAAPGLQRTLKLHHLILYGIIIIQPTAPMSIYGVVSNAARGHAVTTILIAMVAMLFTAVSYGRMARVYPSAGSAYTYVGKEIHPLAGYVVGWSMLMDYMLNPIICAVWCSAAAANILPEIPFAAWAVAFVLVFTGLNLLGVQASSRVNALLALGMSIAVVVFIADAIRYIAMAARPVAGQWLLPFYDPATFTPGRLFHGASIAVLTYIGFDGISTMSEEVENPRRNILLATVLTCFAIGVLAAIEVYLAQLAWPTRTPFPESMVDTAFVEVARRVGGRFLFQLLNGTLIVANMGSGIAAQFGAARLLALWHGARRNAAEKVLRGSKSQDENPAQQRAVAGRRDLARYLPVDL
jgi:amino acid transporter